MHFMQFRLFSTFLTTFHITLLLKSNNFYWVFLIYNLSVFLSLCLLLSNWLELVLFCLYLWCSILQALLLMSEIEINSMITRSNNIVMKVSSIRRAWRFSIFYFIFIWRHFITFFFLPMTWNQFSQIVFFVQLIF